ncbi:MAG: transposase [Sideroxyarcus sp.]|nr:transposase [Sideroxyarcus sp.]
MTAISLRHRRSIRLQGYNYAQAGAYFITICTQNRERFFGEIVGDEMELNNAGKMVLHWYAELENKFSDIQCDEFVCMPNHIHFIVVNVGNDINGAVNGVGADLCVRPLLLGEHECLGRHVGTPLRSGEHVGSPLRTVVQWFKTMTTNAYIRGVKLQGWQRFDGKLWQRNYWEHVVRDESELDRIRAYILNNPAQWESDKLCLRMSESRCSPLYGKGSQQ